MKKLIFYMAFIIFLPACSTTEYETTSNASSTVSNPGASRANIKLGLAYLNQGNRPRAKQKLLLAIKEDPKSSNAYSALAYYMERTGDIGQAKTYYLKAIELGMDKAGPENNYGAFLCRQKQYQAGIGQFLKAARDPRYPNTAHAYENAGLCALRIPDKFQAVSYFEKALQIDPNMAVSKTQLEKLTS